MSFLVNNKKHIYFNDIADTILSILYLFADHKIVGQATLFLEDPSILTHALVHCWGEVQVQQF